MTDERRPSEESWVRVELGLHSGHASMWQHEHLTVVSSLVGGQFHLSVVVLGGLRRPSAVEMLRVRRAFGMLDAAEDLKQAAGLVRHLYLGPCPLHAAERH